MAAISRLKGASGGRCAKKSQQGNTQKGLKSIRAALACYAEANNRTFSAEDLTNIEKDYSIYVSQKKFTHYLKEPYNDRAYFEGIPKSLKNDVRFLVEIVEKFPEVRGYLNELQIEKLKVVNGEMSLEVASEEVKDDYWCVKAAIKHTVSNYSFA